MDTDHILKRLKADCLVITKTQLFGWKCSKIGGLSVENNNLHKNSFVRFVSWGVKTYLHADAKTEKNITLALVRICYIYNELRYINIANYGYNEVFTGVPRNSL